MERRLVLPHQVAGILTGAGGRNPEQTAKIKELGRLPVSSLDISSGKSEICDVCPINPESKSFDPELNEVCNKQDLFFETENTSY